MFLLFLSKLIVGFKNIGKKVLTKPKNKYKDKNFIQIFLLTLINSIKKFITFLIVITAIGSLLAVFTLGIDFLSVLTGRFDFDFEMGFEDLEKEQNNIIKGDTIENRDLIDEALYNRVSDLSYYQAFNNLDKNKSVIDDIRLFYGKDAGKTFFYWLNWDDLRIRDANNVEVWDLKPATGLTSKEEVDDANKYFRDYYQKERDFVLSPNLLAELNNALFDKYNMYTSESIKYPEHFAKPLHFVYDYNRVVFNPTKKTYEYYPFVTVRDKDGVVNKAHQPSNIVFDYAIEEYNNTEYYKEFLFDNNSYYTVANKHPKKYLTKKELSPKMRELEILRGNLIQDENGEWVYTPREQPIEKASDILGKELTEEELKEYEQKMKENEEKLKEKNKNLNEKQKENAKTRKLLINYANSLKNIKYRLGAKPNWKTQPLRLDAVSFINYVYTMATDIEVGDTILALKQNGTEVLYNDELEQLDLLPGDILIFGNDENDEHVMMYTGIKNKEFIHNSPQKGGVTYDIWYTGLAMFNSKEEKYIRRYIGDGWDGDFIGNKFEDTGLNENNSNIVDDDDYNSQENIVKLYYKLVNVKYGQDVNPKMYKSQVKGPYESPHNAEKDIDLLIPQKSKKGGEEKVYILKDGTEIPYEPNKLPKRYYQKVPLTKEGQRVSAKSVPLINTKETRTKRIKESYLNSDEYFVALKDFAERNKFKIQLSTLKQFDGFHYSPFYHGMDKARQNEAVQMFEKYILENGKQGVEWEWSKDGSRNYPLAKPIKDRKLGLINLERNINKNYQQVGASGIDAEGIHINSFYEYVDSNFGKPNYTPAGEKVRKNDNQDTNMAYPNSEFYWNKETNWIIDKTYKKDLPLEIESIRDWGLGSILVYLEDRVVDFQSGLYADDKYNPQGVKQYFAKYKGMNNASEGYYPKEIALGDNSFIDMYATNSSAVNTLDKNFRTLEKMKDNYDDSEKTYIGGGINSKSVIEVSSDSNTDGPGKGATVSSNGLFNNEVKFFGPTIKNKWYQNITGKSVAEHEQFINPIKYYLSWFDKVDITKKIKLEDGEFEEIKQAGYTVLDTNNSEFQNMQNGGLTLDDITNGVLEKAENKMTLRDPQVGKGFNISNAPTIKSNQDWANMANANRSKYLEQLRNPNASDFVYLEPTWAQEAFVIEQALTFVGDFLMTYEKTVERLNVIDDKRVVDAFIGDRYWEITGWDATFTNPETGETKHKSFNDNIKIYNKHFGQQDWINIPADELTSRIQGYYGFDGSGSANYGLGNYGPVKPPLALTRPTDDDVEITVRIADHTNSGYAFPLYRNYRGWKKRILPKHTFTYINGEEFERWKIRTDSEFKDSKELEIIIEERDEALQYLEDYMMYFEANIPFNVKDAMSLKRRPSSKYKRIAPGESNKSHGTFTVEHLKSFQAEAEQKYWKELLDDLEIDDVSTKDISQILQGLAEVEREKSWKTMKGYYKKYKNIEIEDTPQNKKALDNTKSNETSVSLTVNGEIKDLELTNVGIMTIPNIPINKETTLNTKNIGEDIGIDAMLIISDKNDQRTSANNSIHYSSVKLAKLIKKYESIPIGIYAYTAGEKVVINLLDEIQNTTTNDDNTSSLSWKNISDKVLEEAIIKAIGIDNIDKKDGKIDTSNWSPQQVTKVLAFVESSEARNTMGSTNSINKSPTSNTSSNNFGVKLSGEDGKEMDVPDNGGDASFKSYMSYEMITAQGTKQMELNHLDERAYTDSSGMRRFRKGDTEDEQYDDWMVAVGSYYGKPGDRISITLESGLVFTAIIGDQKADAHTNALHQYHESDGSYVEFIIDNSKFLGSMAAKMGNVSYLEYDWMEKGAFQGKVVGIAALTGTPPGASGSTQGLKGSAARVTFADELKEQIDILIGRDYQALRTDYSGVNNRAGSGVEYYFNHLTASEAQQVIYKAAMYRSKEVMDPFDKDKYFKITDLIGNPQPMFDLDKGESNNTSFGEIGGAESAANLEELSTDIYNLEEYRTPITLGKDNARYTSPFGCRWGRIHAGVDIGANTGAKIRSIAPGTVIKSGYFDGDSGIGVMIAHPIDPSGQHHIVSVYTHMISTVKGLNVGDKVQGGQVIGLVGNTGKSTGPHLHFEVRLRWVEGNVEYKASPGLMKYGVPGAYRGSIVMNPFWFSAEGNIDPNLVIQYTNVKSTLCK